MTRAHILTFGAALLTLSQALHAQAPPRPNDTPRAVTLTLAEYNRLLDLANRPPQGALVAPLEGVVGSADLRVRVDGDTVRGEFAITGDAFRAGINRVNL